MATVTSPSVVYDSAARRTPVITEFRNFWRYRKLIRVLAVRDLTVRYKRSVLGVWWTLLNPLLNTAVMYLVFNNLLGRNMRAGVPFIVYLLSGVLLMSSFTSGVNSGGNALVGNRGVLLKVPLPAEIFSYASATGVGVNMLFTLVPLLVMQLITGAGIPWTALLAWIPAVFMLALVMGLGLLVGSAAVHFHDVLDLVKVLLSLVTWLVPTIYPIDIIPDQYLWIIKSNPLYSHLVIFRGLIYGGEFAPWWNWVYMISSSLLIMTFGVWVFARARKTLVAML